jgi:hypothetical protein
MTWLTKRGLWTFRYCCYDHPDPALRASLKLECPFNKGQIVLEDDVGRLIRSAAELLDVRHLTPVVCQARQGKEGREG